MTAPRGSNRFGAELPRAAWPRRCATSRRCAATSPRDADAARLHAMLLTRRRRRGCRVRVATGAAPGARRRGSAFPARQRGRRPRRFRQRRRAPRGGTQARCRRIRCCSTTSASRSRRAEDLDGAIACFREAAAVDARAARAVRPSLARVLFRSGRHAEALQALDLLLARSRRDRSRMARRARGVPRGAPPRRRSDGGVSRRARRRRQGRARWHDFVRWLLARDALRGSGRGAHAGASGPARRHAHPRPPAGLASAPGRLGRRRRAARASSSRALRIRTGWDRIGLRLRRRLRRPCAAATRRGALRVGRASRAALPDAPPRASGDAEPALAPGIRVVRLSRPSGRTPGRPLLERLDRSALRDRRLHDRTGRRRHGQPHRGRGRAACARCRGATRSPARPPCAPTPSTCSSISTVSRAARRCGSSPHVRRRCRSTSSATPARSAAAAYDCIVSDRYCIADADAAHYVERPLHVEPCYLPSDPRRAIATASTRADYALPADAIVMYAGSALYKISPETVLCVARAAARRTRDGVVDARCTEAAIATTA